MPGIAGLVSRRPPPECSRMMAAMLRSMCRETFDESGTLCVPEMGLYAGWVAHEGSLAAQQNCASGSRGLRLLLAGECFGDAQLDEPCPDDGGPDTRGSALLRAYEQKDERFVASLNGLFSGLLVDRACQRALLFNDRYGAERIYVHEAGDTMYFASEAKALLRLVPALRTFDDAGIAQFLAYGCTLHGRTLFRGVRLLEGGSLWSIQGGEWRKHRYFVPEEWEGAPALSAAAFEADYNDTFRRVLPRYVGHAPSTGISLTGGLDTRMILACLPPESTPVCYTFAGLSGETHDQRLAARIATACGLEHHVLRIGADFLSDYGRHVDRTVEATDGCCGATGAHEIYLNAQARALAPVRLTGNFGSEILRSMSTFKPIGLARDLLHPDMARLVESVEQAPGSNGRHPVTFSAFQEIPWNLFGSMAAGRSQVTFRTPYLDNEIVSLAFRAPALSRQTPAAAVRVVTDNRRALSAIPTDRGLLGTSSAFSRTLRQLLSEISFKLDYYHQDGLPRRLDRLDPVLGLLSHLGVLGRHKFLPFRHWFRRELAPYVTAVVTDSRASRLPWWNARFLEPMTLDHIAGRANYVREINAVLTLQAVERLVLQPATDWSSE